MVGKALTYFMWGWQAHFRVSAQVDAEAIFGRMDPRLDPNVFLLGVLRSERNDRHPICLEPEDCGYVIGDFAGIEDVADELSTRDPAHGVFHSHTLSQQAHRERIPKRAIRTALLQAFDASPKSQTRVSYVSWPVPVEGYWVMVVLQLRREVVEEYPALVKSQTADGDNIKRSLIESAAGEFLNWNAQELLKPDARGRSFDRDASEFIRAAGRELMHTPAAAGGNMNGLYGLFAAACDIAVMRYEGAEGRGGIVVSRRGHPNLEVALSLAAPVPLRQHRAVRKLLEMTSDDIYLLSDSADVYGLGRPVPGYDPTSEDLFVISVTAHHTWDLLHGGHSLMRVAYGEPSLPRLRLNELRFKHDLARVFTGPSAVQPDILWQLTAAAMERQHGTMLVVATDAAAEAVRLKDQCTPIKPMALDAVTLRRVSSIDGAVLLDPQGVCHAVGVILDGIARPGRGSPARGARYNSAIRYVEGSIGARGPCIAVVVSEDGSVDLIPELKPQVSRSEIDHHVDVLRIESASNGEIDVAKYNKSMDWLSRHEFYLSPEICDEVNGLRRAIQLRVQRQVNITIVYRDLESHRDMNDGYLVP